MRMRWMVEIECRCVLEGVDLVVEVRAGRLR